MKIVSFTTSDNAINVPIADIKTIAKCVFSIILALNYELISLIYLHDADLQDPALSSALKIT